jgi:hypothetical protein
MGILVYSTLRFGMRLVITAPRNVGAGPLNVVFFFWCGLLLIAVALWLLWEVWNAVAPKPITDDFLMLLNHSFGYDWRRPSTWPWRRFLWAYGFMLVGAISTRLVWSFVFPA